MNNYDSVVSSFYLAYYGRPADPAGLAFWSAHLERANGDLTAITRDFAQSEEALVRFDTKTTSERIADIYLQLFNRVPDGAGLQFWAEAVDSGRTTLADVSMDILKGAQGSDITISGKRQAAAEEFTRIADALDAKFSGYAAVTASQAMLMAINGDTTQATMLQVVQSLVPMVNALDANPAVLDALAPEGNVGALFLSPRGRAEPESLFLAMSDLTKAAAGNPATLDMLLRGGGMGKVLEVMPSKVSLSDVVGALAQGGKNGLDAAVELVYPTPRPGPITVPAPTMKFGFEAGALTLHGKATDPVVVDLGKNIVTFKGQDQQVAGTIEKIVASDYAGKVAVAGNIAQLKLVGPQSPGVDLQIIDSKTVIFNLVQGNTSVAPEIADLIVKSTSIKLLETVSAREFEALKALEGFDIAKLQSSIDLTPPDAGKIVFEGLDFADPQNPVAYTNKDSISFKALDMEAGAQVRLQQFDEQLSDWSDLPTFEVNGLAEGEHRFRSVVEDAAGNVSYAEAMVSIDKTPPKVTKLQFAANDGTIAAGESIELTVTFDGPINVSEDTRIQFSNDGSAAYQRGNGTSELVFSYTPQAGHGTPALKLDPFNPFTGTIVDRAGNALSLGALADIEPGAAPQVDVSAPAQSIAFTTISQRQGASASVEGGNDPLTTNLETATISVTLSGVLGNGEHVEYSLDGGQNWSEDGVLVEGRSVYINGVATAGNPVITARVADAAGNAGKETSHAIVLDQIAPEAGSLAFASVTDSPLEDDTDPVTNESVVTVKFTHAGPWYGAGERLQYSTDGMFWHENGLTVDTDANLVSIASVDLSHGKLVPDRSGNLMTTVTVRAIDAAGNTSQVGSAELVLNVPLPAPGLRLSSDTGVSAVDNITSKGFVVISGLNKAQGSNWQWAVDGGPWQNGWGSDQNGVATHTIGGEGKHTLLVRQFDTDGDYSAEGKLEFTLDTRAAVLSFQSVSGATVAEPNVVDSDRADVTFGYTGDVGADDRIAYRIDGGEWISDDRIMLDTANGTITLVNMDLSKSDPLIELQVTDVAGNASNVAQVTVDGAYGVVAPSVTTMPTADGLVVTSTVAGSLFTMFDATAGYGAYHTGGSDAIAANVPVTIGAQPWVEPGPLAVGTGGANFVYDASGRFYLFGTPGEDTLEYLGTSNAGVWGFDGNDTIRTGDGDDIIYAGNGANTITGGKGADRIDLALGANTLKFAAGDSSIANGIDVVDFGSGNLDTQKFQFHVMANAQSTRGGQADPVDGSDAALLAALASGYAEVNGNAQSILTIVTFVNQDRYLVLDTGDGVIDANDYVIQLVGAVPGMGVMMGEVWFSAAP